MTKRNLVITFGGGVNEVMREMISASAGDSFNVGINVWDQRIVKNGVRRSVGRRLASEQEKPGEVEPKRWPST